MSSLFNVAVRRLVRRQYVSIATRSELFKSVAPLAQRFFITCDINEVQRTHHPFLRVTRDSVVRPLAAILACMIGLVIYPYEYTELEDRKHTGFSASPTPVTVPCSYKVGFTVPSLKSIVIGLKTDYAGVVTEDKILKPNKSKPTAHGGASDQRDQSPPSSSIDSSLLAVGSSKYIVTSPLSFGASGSVDIAVNTTTQQQVAIKRIPSLHHEVVEEAKRELSVLKRIQSLGGHQNLVSYLDYDEDDDYIYVVTELIPGAELYQRMRRLGTFQERDAAGLVRQVAEALVFLHQHSILHGDLKPENLVLDCNDDSMTIKLVDFGSARILDTNLLSAEGLSSSRTVAYCAPETLLGHTPSPAADIWALGCILYVMLAGIHPFDPTGRSSWERIEKRIINQPPPFCGKRWKSISEEAQDLIQKLLDFNPNHRPSAEEILQHPWILRNAGKRYDFYDDWV